MCYNSSLPLKLFSLLFLFVSFSYGGSLKEVETIPEEQRASEADFLGPSLSLGREDYARKVRGFVHHEEIDDQKMAGSVLLGPSVAVGHGLGYGGYGNENYGLQKGGAESYGHESGGNSQGEIGFYGKSGQRGSSGRVSEGAYENSRAGKHGNAANSGYYGDAAGVKKGYDVGNGYAGAQSYGRSGQAANVVGAKGGHRKGYQASGFQNSYHKDESGKTAKFFEDGLEEDGHYSYDAKDGAYDDRGGSAYKGDFQDAAYYENDKGNQGKYASAEGYDDEKGQKGLYSRDDYYDDRLQYGQEKAGKQYGEADYGKQGQYGDGYYSKAGGVYGEDAGHHGYGTAGDYVAPHGGYYNAKAGDYHPTEYYPYQSDGYARSYYPVGDHLGYTASSPLLDGVPRKGKGFATYIERESVLVPYYQDKPLIPGGAYYPSPYLRRF